MVNIIFVALSIAIVFTCFWLHRIKKNKKKYTREPFASCAIILIAEIAILGITQISPALNIFDFLIQIINPYYVSDTKAVMTSKILIFLIVVFVDVIIYRVLIKYYMNWDGAISKRQFRFDSYNKFDVSVFEPTKMFFCDACLQAKSKFSKSKIVELEQHKSVGKEYEINFEYESDIPWFKEFAEIYKIQNSQVRINISSDWHSSQSCFIADSFDNTKVAIYVSEEIPTQDEVKEFIKYTKKFNYNYLQYLVAVKNNPSNKENVVANIDGCEVKVVFKNNMLKKLVDFSMYFKSIESRLNSPIIQNFTLSTSDVYTPLLCTKNNKEQQYDLLEYIKNWLNEGSNKHLAILGDYGQGKTVSSLKLTSDLINSNHERIPIFIQLRGKSPRNSTPIEILSYFASQYSIDPVALDILNRNGKLLLIFDGFDEMDYVGDENIRKLHFRSLWRLISPKSKLLITGRSNYFFDEVELKSALGINYEYKSLPQCEPLYLCKLNKSQILDAIRNTEEDVKNGIKNILDKKVSESFIDLISRPSQLFLVTQIWKQRQLEKKYQNLTAATIINEFLLNCYERQEEKTTNRINTFLSPIEREYFMLGIALKMHKLSTLTLDKETLIDTIEELISIFPETISKRNSSFSYIREGLSLRDFADGGIHNKEALITDIRVCGILVRDEASDNFHFAHKSYYDLLIAKCFLGEYLPNNRTISIMSKALFRQRNFKTTLKNKDVCSKKMLAELIAPEIALDPSVNTAKKKSLTILKQVYKIIYGKKAPKRILPHICFKRYISAPVDNVSEKRRGLNKNISKYFLRLIGIFLIMLICMLAFIFREISFIYSFKNIAISTFEKRNFVGIEFYNEVFIKFITIPIGLGIISNYLIKIVRKNSLHKLELVLYIWYFASKEVQLTFDEITSTFPKSLKPQFKAFIEELTEQKIV